MQIVINIDKDTYKNIIQSEYTEHGFIFDDDKEVAIHAIKNGTPLPKYHGRLIDADYVINHICKSKECYKENCKGKLFMRCVDIMWVDDAPIIIEEDNINGSDKN